MAKRRGAMIHDVPEIRMRIVPGRRCRTKPPTVDIIQPPSAMGTYQATTCNGVAAITCSM